MADRNGCIAGENSDAAHQSDSILLRLQWSHWFVISAVATFVLARWFWVMPHGFPLDHPRTLANTIFPLLACTGCLCASVACSKRSPIAVLFVAVVPGIGLGLMLGCLVLYPHSMLTLKMAVLSIAPFYMVIAYGIFWWMAGNKVAMGKSVVFFAGFIILGFAWAATQRARLPSTLPLNIGSHAERQVEQDVRPESRYFVNGRSRLYVQPFLEFHSLSPDRFWTLFAPRLNDSWVPATTYTVDWHTNNEITTWCTLHEDNYSHLNTFSELEFSAAGKIAIAFSPCPNDRITVRRADYPDGKPARFAYLGADGVFHIVEASSGEKGPFTELASALCDRNHELEITLFSDDEPAFILRFDDFLVQCSLSLSPTAGWGVPQNSIQFHLAADDSETAYIFLSLASTSVGRGFDSVGHQRGIYRNRMKVTMPEQ